MSPNSSRAQFRDVQCKTARSGEKMGGIGGIGGSVGGGGGL